MGFLRVLGVPLGYIIFLIYKIIQNYGLSIIIFTILLKIATIPLYIKQQKSAAKMSALNPLINEINKKYSKNPKKRSEEIQKLYIDNKMNPGAGFLTLIIQIFVLFGMMDVVYRPLTHILQLDSNVVDKALNIFKLSSPGLYQSSGLMVQINLINDIVSNSFRYESLGSDFINSISSLDLNFLGFNLVKVANLTSIAIIIPISAFLFSFLQTLISLKKENMPQVSSTLRFFMIVMPLFSCFLTLGVPIGVSIYWIVSYIFGIFQILLMNKVCNFKKIRQDAVLEFESLRKNKKRVGQTNNQAKISNNSRLSLARKKIEERYGN